MTKEEATQVKADYEAGLKIRDNHILLLEQLLAQAKVERCEFKAAKAYELIRADQVLNDEDARRAAADA